MKLIVFSIFDAASSTFKRPFFARSVGEATRAFTDIASDPKHEVGSHTKDYSLFRLGQFDDNSGKLLPEDRECILHAHEAASKRDQEQPGLFSKE